MNLEYFAIDRQVNNVEFLNNFFIFVIDVTSSLSLSPSLPPCLCIFKGVSHFFFVRAIINDYLVSYSHICSQASCDLINMFVLAFAVGARVRV